MKKKVKITPRCYLPSNNHLKIWWTSFQTPSYTDTSSIDKAKQFFKMIWCSTYLFFKKALYFGILIGSWGAARVVQGGSRYPSPSLPQWVRLARLSTVSKTTDTNTTDVSSPSIHWVLTLVIVFFRPQIPLGLFCNLQCIWWAFYVLTDHFHFSFVSSMLIIASGSPCMMAALKSLPDHSRSVSSQRWGLLVIFFLSKWDFLVLSMRSDS